MDMKCKCREIVSNKLAAKLPNTTAFEKLPELQVNNSAPIGGKNTCLNRKGSNGHLTGPERKKFSKTNQLVNILNALVGFE